ncbi:putative RNA recognition motif domain, nucleotide-binding alpha-beta plait domain superfamily [Helianthus anomalus]
MLYVKRGNWYQGEPWSTVQNRKHNKSRGDGIEWTFLVQNLSDRVTKNILWRAFQPHGYVSDVYVAHKRDTRGRCFGFVRYVGVENMKETLVAMNTLRVFEMKVVVSLAKYDKHHKRFHYGPENLGRSEWRPKDNVGANEGSGLDSAKKQPPYHGPTSSSYIQKGLSFADMLRGNNEVNGQGAKSVKVDGRSSLYPLHCIGRRAGSFGLSYVVGLTVIITLSDKESAKNCIDQHADFFSTIFSNFSLWNGEYVPFSRIVSFNIHGVSFLIRDYSLYDRIGGLFDDIVQSSNFSWQDEDNSSGSVMIVSAQVCKIDENVIIIWNNRSVVVRVSECDGHWKPMFDIGTSNGTNVSDSDSESMSKTELVDMEELEEGEIRNDGEGEDVQNRFDEGSTPAEHHDDLQTPVTVELENLRHDPMSSGCKSSMDNEKSPSSPRSVEVQEPPCINVGLDSKNVHGGMEKVARFPTRGRKAVS